VEFLCQAGEETAKQKRKQQLANRNLPARELEAGQLFRDCA